ncbi:SRPBCC family protein [Flavisolibacter sp. BT320]|nr:SRPBCC family protein [Flavisolibacter longurius]
MKKMVIPAPPQKVFEQMDDFSKTGMHMGESSMLMMGSKLTLEQLSQNATCVGASYRWHGKIMGLAIDFAETVTEWQPPERKEWQTIGKAKIIIMSWYKM